MYLNYIILLYVLLHYVICSNNLKYFLWKQTLIKYTEE